VASVAVLSTFQASAVPAPTAGRDRRSRRSSRLRLTAAIWVGRLAAIGSRVTRLGSGVSIQGKVILGLDPGALQKLLVDTRVAIVSGTNGKTTTSHFLAAAVRASSGANSCRLVHNADGANLHHGIASALAQHPNADLAILETDERVVADMVRLAQPDVLVLLNLSRDQLDRNHEIKAIGQSWRSAIQHVGMAGPVVVANADDPLVVWAAQAAQRVIWVDADTTWTQDSSLCPNCGAKVVREQSDNADDLRTRWHCDSCDLAQPSCDYVVRDGTITDTRGETWVPKLNVPGSFNVSNAAFALAAAGLMGVPLATARVAITSVTGPGGRFATARFGSTTARLMLAKNPAGWAETLPLVRAATVILAIDSAAADGRDVSWLWDVDFERLAGRRVIATGPRAQDLGVRLSHAGVEHITLRNLGQALAGHAEPVDVIATYTPFQRLRKMADS
jgi:UDP-N-acetylmuramyl tripeptide synthase